MNTAVASSRLAGFKDALPAKGKAVGIHVSISLAIFFVVMYFIVFRWYPQPYFATDGGWQGLRIMFGVDVVLGPLLTFVVFNPAKPRRDIVRDLSVVALFQICALIWGVYTIHGQRPVAIVEFDGTFSSAVAEPFKVEKVSLDELRKFDDRTPPLIFERVPKDEEEMLESIRMANQGVMRSAQVSLYERFNDRLPEVFAHAAAFEAKTVVSRPELKAEFARLRQKHGQEIGFLPYAGRYARAILVLNRKGEVVDSLQP